MIKILNQNREPVAILENAYGIGYEREFNSIWTSSFSLPLDDEKNEHCKPLYYVEVYDNGEYIGLFRIIPKETVIDEGGNTVTYQCEHVLASLLDSSIFKYRQIDGLPTSESIQYVLGFQHTPHWELGTCEITRYFSYKFENDNVLSALFSIPKPFDSQYQWTFDTTVYPWKLNLVIPESEPTCEIREGKNLRGLTLTEDPMGIYNRVYPLGYGEGDNQLTIESVNGGVPYIEDAASVSEYGVRMTIWSDKRYESAETLKASAQALMNKWREVIASWRISAAKLSSITGEDIDNLKMGRIVRLNIPTLSKTVDLRIVKERKVDVTGDPGAVELDIGNKTDDLGTTQKDLERRQQINELYSQGATNIDSNNIAENADSTHPVILDIWLPDEVVKVNRFDLTYRLEKFRAYEQAIEGGGAQVGTTGGGGGTTKSSSSGGGTSTSTASDGNHSHMMFQASTGPVEGLPNALFYGKNSAGQTISVEMPANNVDLYTFGASGSHTHSFSVPNHSHTITLENHDHSITLPDHAHGIKYGIYEAPDNPTAVTIKVNGVTVPQTATSGENIDLIPFLPRDSEQRIPRGTWLKVEITPNTLGRVVAQVVKQVFIQSRGEYTL